MATALTAIHGPATSLTAIHAPATALTAIHAPATALTATVDVFDELLTLGRPIGLLLALTYSA